MAANTLDRGRKQFKQQAWAGAYAQLSAADQEGLLEAEDLERLAMAAYLIGRDDDSFSSWARAHYAFLNQEDVEQAAQCAFWLAFKLLNKGEQARGGGWMARARRLLDNGQQACVTEGFLLLPVALQCLRGGDFEGAYAAFDKAAEIGSRFKNQDLITLVQLGRGQALTRLGKTVKGVELLDEAMAAVESEVVSPLVMGIVYCAVIDICQKIYDLRRAQEWTSALTHWCESHPDLVPFRGQCLVNRAEILKLHGAWTDAMEEAQQACEWCARSNEDRAVGAAYYQQAELHRLRGAFAEAEEAYQQASQWGRKSQPGLAQLRLAQGQVDVAKASIDRVVEEVQRPSVRAKVLAAYVEIMLAAGHLQAARCAADELQEIAADFDAPLLKAIANQIQGAVLLEEGKAEKALGRLRRAWRLWQELEVPYEQARVRLLIGHACRKLADEDTAALEFEAARMVFKQLQAAPDLARLDELIKQEKPNNTHGLTPRELQVLHRVAAGETNKSIADKLFISERTVERHVSNILSKLGLSSRAAATAYAYKHELV